MNKNPGFVPQETDGNFYENSESFSNEGKYEDILNERRVYYDASTEEEQIKVPKTIFEAFFNMSNIQYHSESIN